MEKIKVVIGSSITGKGIDFKNIRENSCNGSLVSFK